MIRYDEYRNHLCIYTKLITPKVEKKKKTPPSGRGIIVDDKTVKLLKGLSKSISFVADKPQKE